MDSKSTSVGMLPVVCANWSYGFGYLIGVSWHIFCRKVTVLREAMESFSMLSECLVDARSAELVASSQRADNLPE